MQRLGPVEVSNVRPDVHYATVIKDENGDTHGELRIVEVKLFFACREHKEPGEARRRDGGPTKGKMH